MCHYYAVRYDQGWFTLEVGVLSEIPRVCDSGWAQVGVLTWRGEIVPLLLCTRVSTTLEDFVTLWLIWGCALGRLEALLLGSKTSSPSGKVRYHYWFWILLTTCFSRDNSRLGQVPRGLSKEELSRIAGARFLPARSLCCYPANGVRDSEALKELYMYLIINYSFSALTVLIA